MPMGEERVLGRMKRQHGVITRAQALEAGMTRAQIDRCLRSGRWVSEARGVYRHAAVSSSPSSRLMAACLAFTWDDYINRSGGLCDAVAAACAPLS